MTSAGGLRAKDADRADPSPDPSTDHRQRHSIARADTTAELGDVPPLTLPGPVDMLNAGDLDTMIEQLRATTATTVVSNLYLNLDNASLSVQRPGSPGSYSYYYDGFLGVPTHDQTVSPDDPRIDLAELKTAQLAELVKQLPQRVKVPAPTNTYVNLNACYDTGEPGLSFYASSGAGSGYLTTDLRLDVVDVHQVD
jgi:hypothetical protein